ncbi:MAG: glyoxalase, partial [Bacteroidota bacterium]
MDSRCGKVLDIRPLIPKARVHDNMSMEERFQNQTLRPIIKMQNLLFVAVFKNYIQKHKGVFYGLSQEKKLVYIEKSIQKDIKFRNSLKGIIIGLFT